MRIIQNSSLTRFLAFAVGDFTPLAIQLTFLPIYTAFLSPADLGLLATVSAGHALLNRLSNLGFEWVLLSGYLASEEPGARGRLTGTLMILSLLVRLALIGTALLVVNVSADCFHVELSESLRQGIYVLCGVFLIEILHTFFYTIAKLERLAARLSGAQVLGAVVTCLISLTLLLHGYGVTSVFYAQFVGAAAQLFLAVPLLLRRLRLGWSREAVVQLKQIGLPALPQGICTYLGKFSDQLIIGLLLGAEALGLYYLALRLCQGFGVLYSTFLSTVISDVSKYVRDPTHAPLLIRWGLLATMGVAALQLPLILFSSELFQGLASSEFHAAHRLAALLLVVPAATGLTMYGNSILVCAGRTRTVSYISVSMNLLLAVFLAGAATWGGLLCVPLALIFGNGLWLLLVLRSVREQVPCRSAEALQLGLLLSLPLAVAGLTLALPSMPFVPKLFLILIAYAAMFGLDCLNRRLVLELVRRLLPTRRPLAQPTT